MPRHTVYLSESDSKLLKELKTKHGSVSNVIRNFLHTLREEQLKEYYIKKLESYPELRRAQKKVMERQEKEEQS
jgi:predicted CopG family antitoxin